MKKTKCVCGKFFSAKSDYCLQCRRQLKLQYVNKVRAKQKENTRKGKIVQKSIDQMIKPESYKKQLPVVVTIYWEISNDTDTAAAKSY